LRKAEWGNQTFALIGVRKEAHGTSNEHYGKFMGKETERGEVLRKTRPVGDVSICDSAVQYSGDRERHLIVTDSVICLTTRRDCAVISPFIISIFKIALKAIEYGQQFTTLRLSAPAGDQRGTL
jgi:hypothetical protein